MIEEANRKGQALGLRTAADEIEVCLSTGDVGRFQNIMIRLRSMATLVESGVTDLNVENMHADGCHSANGGTCNCGKEL